MSPDLSTTNLILTLIAAASIIQSLALVAAAIGGLVLYKRLTGTLAQLEAQQLAPLRSRVDDILVDVKTITARVSQRTERVDDAISGTMERVDETAGRVRESVQDRLARLTGMVRGVRAVIVSMLSSEPRHESTTTTTAAAAGGRV